MLCNYQALPVEEAFSAAGSLRLGVSEMTRFGMRQYYFCELSSLISYFFLRDAVVKAQVSYLRVRFA